MKNITKGSAMIALGVTLGAGITAPIAFNEGNSVGVARGVNQGREQGISQESERMDKELKRKAVVCFWDALELTGRDATPYLDITSLSWYGIKDNELRRITYEANRIAYKIANQTRYPYAAEKAREALRYDNFNLELSIK
jgi:hypothetical protein